MRRRGLLMLLSLAGVAALLHVGVSSLTAVPSAAADPRPGDVAPDAAPAPGVPPPVQTAMPRRIVDPGFQIEPSRPVALLSGRASAPQPPGMVQQRELRRRVGEAAGLRNRADAGDEAARAEVARRLTGEADPRVRLALESGEVPDLGRMRSSPPVLPAPVAAAEAGTIKAWWLTPGRPDGTYESTVTVDGSGRAVVETVCLMDDGDRWHVRYNGWAYRDAQGKLVVDARGQAVECLQKPEGGWWSPDSMVIGTDGLIDMIDDKHDPGAGTRGAQGSG